MPVTKNAMGTEAEDWRETARQGKARQGKARQGKARGFKKNKVLMWVIRIERKFLVFTFGNFGYCLQCGCVFQSVWGPGPMGDAKKNFRDS